MNDRDEEKFARFMKDLKSARFAGDLSSARSLAEDARNLLKKYPEEKHLRHWSTYAYEDAFLLNIEGKLIEAANRFRDSGQYASRGGDKVRGAIGEFRYILTRFLADELSAESTYEGFLSLYATLREMTNVPEIDRRLLRGSQFNLHKRLMDVAFEMSSTDDFERWANSLLQHEDLQRAQHIADYSYQLIRWKTEARLNMIHGKPVQAAGLFVVYLDVDMPDVPRNSTINESDELTRHVNDAGEEMARDYRDLGAALLCTPLPNRQALARAAWRRGLELSPGRGNLRYLNQMRAKLAAMDEESGD